MQRFLNNPRILLAVTAIITALIVGISVFPDKFPSFDKVAQLIPGAPTPYVTLAPGQKPIILAISERKDANVTILNMDALTAIFEQLKIFNKVHNQDVQKDNLPLKKIIIVLTEGKQLYEYKDVFGNVMFSYSLSFYKDYVVMALYLPGNVTDSKDASQMLGAAVIYAAHAVDDTTGEKANIGVAQFNEYYYSAHGLFEIGVKTPNATIPPEIQKLLSPTPTPN